MSAVSGAEIWRLEVVDKDELLGDVVGYVEDVLKYVDIGDTFELTRD
jgi:hypothetical protein